MAARKRYQFLGYIIERCASGWAVIDWDYEHESVIHIARTETAAQSWCADR